MPRKIRQLKRDLRRAGFVQVPGRGAGSHAWFAHALAPASPVNLSGHDGDDAQPYQERAVREALAAIAAARREGQQGRHE